MKEVTVLIPEERIPEFYRRFGDFMSEASGGAVNHGGADTAPAWVSEPGAESKAWMVWNYLSEPGRRVFDVLIDGALQDEPRWFLPEQLASEIGQPNGASGMAGVFGAAGRAVKKAGVPRVYTPEGGQWHYVWNWNGLQYSMHPEVAALFRAKKPASLQTES